MKRADGRTLISLAAAVAVIAVAVGFVQPKVGPGRGGPGGPKDSAEANPEAEEQAEEVAERLQALEAARAAGKVGQQRPANAVASAGWTGEQPFEASAPDDWEPAIATDPNSQHVYALVTRYGAGNAPGCSGKCPEPWIALRISSNNGATWAATKPLCACKSSGQFDPIIEVVPDTGDVYSVFMIGFNVVFTKSNDFGATWTAPVSTWGNVAWNDKPALAMSDDGLDVYVSFNGPTGGDPYATVSHDFGATWSQVKLVDSGRYFYAFDADVDADGNVYFSESSLLYANAGKSSTLAGSAIEQHVFVSRDNGTTWEDHLVATVQSGIVCTAAGCKGDFYQGHTALSVDDNGGVVLLYDGAPTPGGLQTIEARRSTDIGAHWSNPVRLSTLGEEATSPAVESQGRGDVRAWWMETSGGGNVDAWNVWYRSSTNGGSSWTTPVRLSDAGGGAAYKTPAGFFEVYGDSGEIAITSAGKTIAIWGEGLSYTGPGGVWYNRQLP